MKNLLFFILFFFLYGCGTETISSMIEQGSVVSETPNDTHMEVVKAFFGDEENNRVVVVDVDHMQLLSSDLYTGHLKTHTADKVAGKKKVYVVNRGSDAIDVIDTRTHQFIRTIPLRHHPRSAEAMNKEYGLCAVSGMDKPMVSIIDTTTDEVVVTVGEDRVTYPVSAHGGSHACGHPFWLDKDHFVLLDRASKSISTYRLYKDALTSKWHAQKLNTLVTSSSLHQIIPSKGNYQGEKNIFYATAEGSDDVYPSIVKFVLTESGLFQVDEFFLKPDGLSPKDVSIHHGDFHPFLPLIYVGSSDGTLFVLNYAQEDMKLETKLVAGKGAGHTVMAKKKKLGIVINHKDSFVTLVDLQTNRKIKDVFVSDFQSSDVAGGVSIQAHPKYYVSKDGKFLYAFLTYEGILYKLDLDKQVVVSRLPIGGQLEQGSFVVPFSPPQPKKPQIRIDFRDYLPRHTLSIQSKYFFFNYFGVREEPDDITVEVGSKSVVYDKDVVTDFGISENKIVIYLSGVENPQTGMEIDRYIEPGYYKFYSPWQNILQNGMSVIRFVQKLNSLSIGNVTYRGDMIHIKLYYYKINDSYDYEIIDYNMYLMRDKGLIAYIFSNPISDDPECIANKPIYEQNQCVKRVHLGRYFIFDN